MKSLQKLQQHDNFDWNIPTLMNYYSSFIKNLIPTYAANQLPTDNKLLIMFNSVHDGYLYGKNLAAAIH